MARETEAADFYIKFGGTHAQTGVDEPKLGEMVEFTVYGQVVGVYDNLRGDGETRHTVNVDVEAAWPKGTPRPDNANQGTLVDHDGNVTDEAQAGELIDTEGDDDGEA